MASNAKEQEKYFTASDHACENMASLPPTPCLPLAGIGSAFQNQSKDTWVASEAAAHFQLGLRACV